MAWRLNIGVSLGLAAILVFGVWDSRDVDAQAGDTLNRYIGGGLRLGNVLSAVANALDNALYEMKSSALLAPLIGALVSSPATDAKLDITSETTLDCGAGPNDLTAGYLDLDTGSMFFTLFHAKAAARDQGLVIYFGGGPGASSWDYGLIGAAPCQLKKGENGTLEPSPFPWTDHANLLLLDYPIGAGWSYNNPDQIAPNTSEVAALDFDQFLQTFLIDKPEYLDQPLILASSSYGGFLAAYISDLIVQRDEDDTSGKRIKKRIDQIYLGNPFGDVGADLRWRHEASCVQQPAVWDAETCAILDYAYPKSQAVCQDSLLWADEHPSLETRTIAFEDCVGEGELAPQIRNAYNRFEPACSEYNGESCFWWMYPLMNFMGSDYAKRELLNVRNPDTFYWYVNSSALNFYYTHDNMQNSAFKRYESGLAAGTRMLVASGDADTVCPWQGSYSWMLRTNGPDTESFRASNWTSFAPGAPGEGEVVNPGSDFTLLKIANASHFHSMQNPKLAQAIIAAAVDGRNYDPTNP